MLATRNAGKARELQALLGPGYTVITAAQAGFDGDPEETGKTFYDNAWIKARAVAAHVPHAVLADDSGLEVAALGGAPGIYSARYAGPKADDAANRAKLLAAMQGEPRREARFVCVLCLLAPQSEPLFFPGNVGGISPRANGETRASGMIRFSFPRENCAPLPK